MPIPRQNSASLRSPKFAEIALTLFWLVLAIPSSALQTGEWGTTTSPHFTLTYDQREERLIEEVIGSAEDGLERMAKWLGFRPQEKLRIWVCSTESQFDSLTRSGIPDWGIGCAFPKSGAIVLKSPRVVRRNLDLKTIVPHEIAHVLLGQLLGEFTAPRWFDEGFAIYQSKEWRLTDGFTLGWARIANALIPLSKLEDDFPWEERKGRLAYTEGFSAVSFIAAEYGEETLRELISAMAKYDGIDRGEGMDTAMVETLGLRYEEFEELWLNYVRKSYNIAYLLSTTPFFWGGMAFLLLLIFFIKRVKTKRRLAEPDFA